MQFRPHFGRAFVLCFFASLGLFAAMAPLHARAQDDNPPAEKHGRKYKAPPETSRIEVTVLKGFNKKPIDGAHVIFHPVKDGKDEGNLEVKTHLDGKVVIDVIPIGSSVRVQVLADGFATFAEDYVVTEPNREIVISMVRPRAQISTYIDNSGKPSELKPGVQEPIRPKKAKPDAGATPPPGTPPAPSATTPATPDSKPQK